MKKKDILELVKKTLDEYQICDSCLGRLFREIEKGSSNNKKGKLIRKELKNNKEIEPQDCCICEGLIAEIEHFISLISETLKDYEYRTFLIGTKVDDDIIKNEQKVWEFLKIDNPESIKTQLNREIGKILELKLKKEVDFLNPTIMVIVDTAYDVVNLQIKSIFIYGRYKKLIRGLPQTTWYCKLCNGVGCKTCNYKGRLYDSSIEDIVSKEALNITQGTDVSFHGCGREDIDVLMLGNGRPFVLEVKNPKTREFDLSKYQEKVNTYNENKIEINNLHFSNEDEIKRIKGAEFNKIYRITIECKNHLNKEKLKEVAHLLQGKTIKQFTPTRVSHRRANKTRERKIYNCDIESVEGNIARIIVETESGTYVKELISGDNGKTNPNLSDIIGIPCIVKELDVIEIKGE